MKHSKQRVIKKDSALLLFGRWHAILTAYINGVPFPALLDFSVAEQIGNKTSTKVKVDATGLPAPNAGDILELKDSSTDDTLFWGLCGIPRGPKYNTGLEKPIYTITCSNANAVLANRIINVAYQEYTVSQIVQKLYDDYISAEGIALGVISNLDVAFAVYTAKDYNLQDALDELADLAGATWHITQSRVFEFVALSDLPRLSTPITRAMLPISNLQHTARDYKTRTVQIISGATDTTSPQTESYTYDGTQKAFAVIFPVAKKPEIYINGVQVPPERIGVNGLNDDDADMAFLFSYNSQNINYLSGSEYLSESDKVTFTYTGIFPIRVIATNDNKIYEIAQHTGTSGRRENVQLASSITTQSDALQLANSLLQQFETETNEVRFFVWTDMLPAYGLTLSDLAAGTQIEIDLPEYNISGAYVITERTLTPAYGDMGAPNADKFKAAFVLKDQDYLQSYAETLSNLQRDLTALSVRDDEIVVNVQSVSERLQLSEKYAYAPMYIWPLFPLTSTVPTQGDLFTPGPLDLNAYPV